MFGRYAQTAQPIISKFSVVEEPVKGRPSTKFHAPASTAAPGIRPRAKGGDLTKTEISAPPKSFAHNSETDRPIPFKFGDNHRLTLAYVSTEGIPPAASDGPATSRKPSKSSQRPISSGLWRRDPSGPRFSGPQEELGARTGTSTKR